MADPCQRKPWQELRWGPESFLPGNWSNISFDIWLPPQLMEKIWVDLFFSLSLEKSLVLTGCLLCGHLKSIFRVLEYSCRLILASVSTAFSTTLSQKSSSWTRASNLARIESHKLFLKYRIKLLLLGTATESYSLRTDWEYSKYAAKSLTSSC